MLVKAIKLVRLSKILYKGREYRLMMTPYTGSGEKVHICLWDGTENPYTNLQADSSELFEVLPG